LRIYIPGIRMIGMNKRTCDNFKGIVVSKRQASSPTASSVIKCRQRNE
jgi:hypothetical protein